MRFAAANYNARPAHFVLRGELSETGPASPVSLRVSQSPAQRKATRLLAAFPFTAQIITTDGQPTAPVIAVERNRYTVRDVRQAVIDVEPVLSRPSVPYGPQSFDPVWRLAVDG